MKLKLSALIILVLFYGQNIYAQSKNDLNYYFVGGFADISADFIYLHYGRIGIQHYLSNRFSLQGSFKIGSRSLIKWTIPSDHDGVSINWINWHKDNLSGNPFIFKDTEELPEKLGISSYQINDESLFYGNLVISGGWRVPVFFKGYLEALIGIGIRYTDNHYIGESGDSIFEYNGIKYQVYYLVPVYQRGIDGHFNLELNLTFPITENIHFRPSFVTDFTAGTSNIGVGNYYSAGVSILVKI